MQTEAAQPTTQGPSSQARPRRNNRAPPVPTHFQEQKSDEEEEVPRRARDHEADWDGSHPNSRRPPIDARFSGGHSSFPTQQQQQFSNRQFWSSNGQPVSHGPANYNHPSMQTALISSYPSHQQVPPGYRLVPDHEYQQASNFSGHPSASGPHPQGPSTGGMELVPYGSSTQRMDAANSDRMDVWSPAATMAHLSGQSREYLLGYAHATMRRSELDSREEAEQSQNEEARQAREERDLRRQHELRMLSIQQAHERNLATMNSSKISVHPVTGRYAVVPPGGQGKGAFVVRKPRRKQSSD